MQHLPRFLVLAGVLLGCHRPPPPQITYGDEARGPRGERAYIKPTPGRTVDGPSGPEQATELWLSNPSGRESKLVISGAAAAEPESTLVGMSAPEFSPDGRRLYFLSRAWVTSDALHVIELASGRQRFLAPALYYEIVPRGRYAGYLLITQHRYRPGPGGSYDWTWLYSPDGHEIGVAATDSSDDALDRWKAANIPPEH